MRARACAEVVEGPEVPEVEGPEMEGPEMEGPEVEGPEMPAVWRLRRKAR